MAQLLGDRFLPESVSSTRQRVRSRLSDLREPIRSRRESLVPGPDIVGMAENQFSSLRRRFVTRETLLSRIRDQAPGMGGDSQGQQGQDTQASEPSEKRDRSGQMV